jgi:Leucine-rich repeat (LRR) protein
MVIAALESRSWQGTGCLDLHGLRLRSLPDTFSTDLGIRRIDLSGNRLTELPPSLFRLGELEELDLGNNRLTALAPDIGMLTRLTRLDVSENRLSTVAPALTECAALQHLHLYGNALTRIAPLGKLPALTTLDLSGNRLRSLDGLTPALVSLDVSGNHIAELPDDILKLTRLRRLDLSDNLLASVDALLGLQIEQLHLDGNALPVRPDALVATPTLRRFSALGNPFDPADGLTVEVHKAVRRHTTGHADPTKQYFDAATLVYAFSLAVSGASAIWTVVDHYYKRFKGVGVAVMFADGTQIELRNLSRKTALRLVGKVRESTSQRVLVDFQSTKDLGQQRATAEFVVQSVARLDSAELVPKRTPGQIIHLQQVSINSEVTMGDKIIIGNIANSNVNVKSTLINVTQTVGAAMTLDGSTKAELTRLVNQLTVALEQLPPEQAENADAIAKTTADLVEKATTDKPNKKLVETGANGLRALVDGLGTVAPIVLGIIDIVTKIVGA